MTDASPTPTFYNARPAFYQKKAERFRNHVQQGFWQECQLVQKFLPKYTRASQMVQTDFTEAEAQQVIAQCYGHKDWSDLMRQVATLQDQTLLDTETKTALQAAENGNLAILETLIDSNPQLANCRGATEQTILDIAIQAPFHGKNPHGNQKEIVALLLGQGAEVNSTFYPHYGETPLHSAVSLYERELAELLIEEGANMEAIGGVIEDGTPLVLACFFGASDCAQLLYEKGAKVFNIYLASALGKLDLVESCLKTDLTQSTTRYTEPTTRSISPQLTEKQILQKAYIYALFHHQYETMEFLAGQISDFGLDEFFLDDLSPLHWAAYRGQTEVIAYLLKKGANPQLEEPNFQATPLGWAKYHQQEKAVTILEKQA